MYRFIIDESSSVQIVQTNNKGQVDTVLASTGTGDSPIMTLSKTKTVTFNQDHKEFMTEKMYYLIVKGR